MNRRAQLRELVAENRVVPVFGIPTAAHARMMQASGVEVAFIGTLLTMGNYTALPDTGVVTMTEGIGAARYITRAVDFPVIFDGDTGHGGDAAVRRLVEECIDAGLAGLRIDDQLLETKRMTLSPGIMIEDRDAALHRYATAVQRRDELDAEFMILAQCYARNAVNGGKDVYLDRLSSYHTEAGVDWVNFECPFTLEEVREAREAVPCPLSIMQGRLAEMPALRAQHDIGLDMAWFTFLPDLWMKAAAWEIMQQVSEQGLQAWQEYMNQNPGNPFVRSRSLDVDHTLGLEASGEATEQPK